MSIWLIVYAVMVGLFALSLFLAFRSGVILEYGAIIEQDEDRRRFALARLRLVLNFAFVICAGSSFGSARGFVQLPFDHLVLFGAASCLMATSLGVYLLEGFHRGQMELGGITAQRGDLDFLTIALILSAAAVLFGGAGLFVVVKGLS